MSKHFIHQGGIFMADEAKKLCKYCKSEIDKNAKICPHCRKKQGGKGCLIAGVIFAIIVIGGAAGSGGSKSSTTQSPSSSTVSSSSSSTDNTAPQEAAVIEYTDVTADELVSTLDNNSAAASAKYKGQYLSVTGKLSVIDSDLKYISLSSNDDFSFTTIHCTIKNEEQKQAILNMNKDDVITVKGKCTDVGEIMGYSLDIDSIG